MNKYGIPMYRGSHISNNGRIEAIEFDGEFWIMSDMWLLSVGLMSELWEPKIKVCKVDIKIMLENFFGGPPIIMYNIHYIDIYYKLEYGLFFDSLLTDTR